MLLPYYIVTIAPPVSLNPIKIIPSVNKRRDAFPPLQPIRVLFSFIHPRRLIGRLPPAAFLYRCPF